MIKLFISNTKFILSNILLILFIVSCGSPDVEKVINPNAKEYKKIEVSQESKEEEKIKLKKVKERRTYSKFTDFIIKGGGKEVLVERINYDKNGNITEQYRYSATGVQNQWLFDYDEFGNKKSIQLYDVYQNLIEKEDYEFASNGILKKIKYSKGKQITYFEYYYDKFYNLVEKQYFDAKKNLTTSTKYKYKNSLLDSVIIYSNNLVINTITFEYDSLKRRAAEKLFQHDKMINTYEYIYDDFNNLIHINNLKLSKNDYVYDNDGNIKEETIYDKNGNQQTRMVYEYLPNNGLLKNKVKFDGENNAALEIRFEYDYY